jgi:RIO kinase 1
MLERDVNNMRATFGRTVPELLETQYAREIWKLYEASELRPDSALTGRFARDSTAPDVNAVLHQIDEERREAEARQRRRDEADAA